ncbi:MAG: hypothetical protein Q7J51_05470 [Sheuella sp.]|nr:hypothetical protein [Sheuella sp.]
MKKLIWLLLGLLMSLYGCARYNSDPRAEAEKKDWKLAYIKVDSILAKNNKQETEKMILFAKEYPEILESGFARFPLDGLKILAVQANDLTYVKNELSRFCIVASVEQCTEANNNLVEAEKLIKKELHLTKDVYANLSKKEQNTVSNNFKIIFYAHDEVGIITDREVRNLSTPGSNFGAEAGGAAGAVAYVNNVNPSNYSLSKDVSSTLLGAFVGAALFNKQAVDQYEIRYTVKLRNGDLKQFDVLSSTPLAEGIGFCIGMPYGTKVDQSLCTMTLAEFRVKYAGDLNN